MIKHNSKLPNSRWYKKRTVRSNIYLDKLDKELEQRGLRFTRYADDVLIFTKSEMAANRVMKSISGWLERKLFLKVNTTKTKVVRPMRNKYLGFTFLKNGGQWKVKPTTEKKKKLKKKPKTIYRNLCYLNWKNGNGVEMGK